MCFGSGSRAVRTSTRSEMATPFDAAAAIALSLPLGTERHRRNLGFTAASQKRRRFFAAPAVGVAAPVNERRSEPLDMVDASYLKMTTPRWSRAARVMARG